MTSGTGELKGLIRRLREARTTYLGPPKLSIIATTCQEALLAAPNGIVVEAGTALGGSAILLTAVKPTATPLEVYDTFSGIPAPGVDDDDDSHERFREISAGRSAGLGDDVYYGYQDDLVATVTDNFERFDLPLDPNHVSLIKGDLRETLTSTGPPVAFAHIDVDWHEPTLWALECVWARLAVGGRIVIDDYSDWSGCRKAVEAFLLDHSDAGLVETGAGSAVVVGPAAAEAAPTAEVKAERKRVRELRLEATGLRTRLTLERRSRQQHAGRKLATIGRNDSPDRAITDLLREMTRYGYTPEAVELARFLTTDGDGREDAVDAGLSLLTGRNRGTMSNAWRDALVAAGAGDDAPLGALGVTAETIARLRDEVFVRPAITQPAIGVLHYGNKEMVESSDNIGDYVQTLGVLTSLAALVQPAANDPFGATIERLRSQLRDEPPSDLPTVDLVPVSRDTMIGAPGEPLWTPLFGWFLHRLDNGEFVLPPSDPVRTIPIAIHIAHEEILDLPGVTTWLHEIGPVGCRDWATVMMCGRRGIPAFFAGCTTTVLSRLHPRLGRDATRVVESVDAEDRLLARSSAPLPAPDVVSTHISPAVRTNSLAANLDLAWRRLEGYAGRAMVLTSRLHCYLPTRSLGVEAILLDRRPADSAVVPGDPRLDGLADLSADDIDAMGRRINTLYAGVVADVVAGKSDDDMRSSWRSATAELVDRTRTQLDAERSALVVPTLPAPTPDRAPASAAPAVTSPASPVDVAMAFDHRHDPYGRLAIYSLIESSETPLRVHVLGRGLEADDLAAFFTKLDVEHHHHDMTEVDHAGAFVMGRIDSDATLDRVLLPELLPDTQAVLYLDTDILVLGDIAVLRDELAGGARFAARRVPVPSGPFHVDLTTRIEALGTARAHELRVWLLASGCDLSLTTVNAGVLALNLDRLRAEDFSRFFPAMSRYGIHEQDLLNLYGGSDVAELDSSWNTFPRFEPIDGAKILHWVGAKKPWSHPAEPGADLWWETAERMADATGYRINP